MRNDSAASKLVGLIFSVLINKMARRNFRETILLANEMQAKLERLKSFLHGLDGVAVAFSGGVDSTFLLKVAHETLGDKVIALTASSEFVPRREIDAAKKFCSDENIRQIIFAADVLNIDGVKENPVNRCYLCKRALFENFLRIAAENNFAHVVEGSNTDDAGDFRPGMRALAELKIKSPLKAAELSKAEIRALSREMNLPTADKPSMACLASRFVYGEELTAQKLSTVEAAENFLSEAGFKQLRVRVHGNLARIEIPPEDFSQLMTLRTAVVDKLKSLGFAYVTLDLQGFRTGSMNEVI